MKFAYADPPYPGQSAKHYSDHPDYDGEVDHYLLCLDLVEGIYDGWALHTSAPALQDVLEILGRLGQSSRNGDFRIFSWVKPFAAFKKNVSPAYAWEPIIVKPLRKGEPNQRPDSATMRDWFSESITLKRGLTGAKPDRLCYWLFEACGLTPDDTLTDFYPGSGAVTRAWESWRAQLQLRSVA